MEKMMEPFHLMSGFSCDLGINIHSFCIYAGAASCR